MIYTVTFNPSLDYLVSVKNFRLGETNRTFSERIRPAGKGINISVVLRNLGIESTALGFTAGFVGEEIARSLQAMGLRTDFIPLEKGNSRINVKLKSIDGTEINGAGPEIGPEKLELLMDRLETLKEGDVLFLAGSVPAGVPKDIYSNIVQRLNGRGVLSVVDASGELLKDVPESHPFLIKPNHHELGEFFGVKLKTRDEAVFYGQKMRTLGAGNVLISLAGEGAVLVAEDGSVWSAPAPQGTLVSSVGAGDSMAAGFMAGWMWRQDYGYAFHMGIAAGSASAFSEELCTREKVEEVYGRIPEGCPVSGFGREK